MIRIRTFALVFVFALAACNQTTSNVHEDPRTRNTITYQGDGLGAQVVSMNACFPQVFVGDEVQFCNVLVVHRDGAVVRISRIDQTEPADSVYRRYVVYIEDRDTGIKLDYMQWHAARYHGQPIGQTIVGFVQFGDARYPELERHARSGTLIGT